MNRIAAIKAYFSGGEKHGFKYREVPNAEIMALSKEDRTWLGDEAAKALGVTITAS